MSSAISVILALTLSADPVVQPPPPRVPRAGILITASLGLAFIGTGTGFELYARTLDPPPTPPAPGTTAPPDYFFVGGISLIATGLCALLISALLTKWYTPKTVFGVTW